MRAAEPMVPSLSDDRAVRAGGAAPLVGGGGRGPGGEVAVHRLRDVAAAKIRCNPSLITGADGDPGRFFDFVVDQRLHDEAAVTNAVRRCPIRVQLNGVERYAPANESYHGQGFGNDALVGLYGDRLDVPWALPAPDVEDQGESVLEWLGVRRHPRVIRSHDAGAVDEEHQRARRETDHYRGGALASQKIIGTGLLAGVRLLCRKGGHISLVGAGTERWLADDDEAVSVFGGCVWHLFLPNWLRTVAHQHMGLRSFREDVEAEPEWDVRELQPAPELQDALDRIKPFLYAWRRDKQRVDTAKLRQQLHALVVQRIGALPTRLRRDLLSDNVWHHL